MSEQDGYILFFIFRIDTINNAMVKIIENSSYVLISIILSVRLRTDESTSPDHRVIKQSRSKLLRLHSILMPTLQPWGSPPANRLNTLTFFMDFDTFLCLKEGFQFTQNNSRTKSLTVHLSRFNQNTKQLNRRCYFIIKPNFYW